MATRDLPPSGTIKLSEVKAEFGKGNNLLDYLDEGGVTATPPLKLTDFYGRSAGPRPPSLITPDALFWQHGKTASGTSISHTFSVNVKKGDTCVVAFAAGNCDNSERPTMTIAGVDATRNINYFPAVGSYRAGTALYSAVMTSDASTVTVTANCTRPMYGTTFYLYPVSGSFKRQAGSASHNKWSWQANNNVAIKTAYTPQVGDGFSFIVASGTLSKSFSGENRVDRTLWESTGAWDKEYHSYTSIGDHNNPHSGFHILKDGQQCFTKPDDKTCESQSAAHYVPVISRMTPEEINAEAKRVSLEEEEMQRQAHDAAVKEQRLRMEAEECDS